MLNEIGR